MIKECLKRVIKAIPGFQALDIGRRKLYESPMIDFLVSPLARRLEEWPAKLVIDTTNRCNARCVWCLNPRSQMKRGTMSLNLFEKIIDDYAKRGGKVWIGTFGEPLLDPTILDKIHCIGEHRSIVETTLLTNALLLDSEVAEVLLKEKINLDISLDELNEGKFEQIKGIPFDKVINNTVNVLKQNKEAKYPIKIVIRLKTSDSLEDLKSNPYYAQLKEMATFLEITPIKDTGSIANWGGHFEKEEFFANYLPDASIFDYYKRYNLMNLAPCSQLWANMVINWEGKVVLCCVDMESRVMLGDLKESSIMDVWQGSQIKQIREMAIQRRRKEMVLCRNCDLLQGWQYLKNYYENSKALYKDGFVR